MPDCTRPFTLCPERTQTYTRIFTHYLPNIWAVWSQRLFTFHVSRVSLVPSAIQKFYYWEIQNWIMTASVAHELDILFIYLFCFSLNFYNELTEAINLPPPPLCSGYVFWISVHQENYFLFILCLNDMFIYCCLFIELKMTEINSLDQTKISFGSIQRRKVDN